MVLYFDQLHDQQLDNHDRRLGFHWNVPGLARALGLCVPRKLEAAVSSVLAEAILEPSAARTSRMAIFVRSDRAVGGGLPRCQSEHDVRRRRDHLVEGRGGRTDQLSGYAQ